MEKNKKYKVIGQRATAFVLSTSMLASLAGCAKTTVEMKEKKEEKVEETPIVEQEIVTWADFDESVLMYKVDLDKFLKNKLKLSETALENNDVINLIEKIREELGEDFYTKDYNSNTLCNQNGNSVTISVPFDRRIIVKFHSEKDTLVYDICVDEKGRTDVITRSRDEEAFKFSRYYVSYWSPFFDTKEYSRTIIFSEDYNKYLKVRLHESDYIGNPYTISFNSNMADAKIKISKEEYEALHEIMVSYCDSDNLYAFLSDNIDLLNKYLDLIKEENAEYYDYLCNLINEYMEKADEFPSETNKRTR